MLGANEIFMDAFYTDVRADLAAWREEPRPARATRCGPTSPAATRSRSRPTASAAPRQAGTDPLDRRPTARHVQRRSAELIARSNRLGADPKNTNYAGGNTSAKGTETDPVTGEHVELLWVKGSGGDLGTLTESGLAVLRLDRMRALVDVYPGVEREDEMVAAFDYCLHGKGGAAPSIDTAMHGLVDAAARRPPAPRLRHRDRDRRRRRGADPARSSATRSSWVPWRRPGFQLGLDIAAIKEANPQAVGCILGGHGITAWGDTCEEGEAQLAVDHRHRRGATSPSTARPSRSARALAGVRAAAARPSAARKAAALAPDDPRASPRTTGRMVGHFTDSDVVLDFLAARRAPAAGRARHLLPRPLPAHQGQAAGARPAGRRAASRSRSPGSRSCTRAYREDYQAYYDRHADAGLAGDPRRRPADRAGARASGCSASARTSRPPAWPASSTSTPST